MTCKTKQREGVEKNIIKSPFVCEMLRPLSAASQLGFLASPRTSWRVSRKTRKRLPWNKLRAVAPLYRERYIICKRRKNFFVVKKIVRKTECRDESVLSSFSELITIACFSLKLHCIVRFHNRIVINFKNRPRSDFITNEVLNKNVSTNRFTLFYWTLYFLFFFTNEISLRLLRDLSWKIHTPLQTLIEKSDFISHNL